MQYEAALLYLLEIPKLMNFIGKPNLHLLVANGQLCYSLVENKWWINLSSGGHATPSWKDDRLARFLKKIYSDLFDECEALVVETYLPSWMSQEGLQRLAIPKD